MKKTLWAASLFLPFCFVLACTQSNSPRADVCPNGFVRIPAAPSTGPNSYICMQKTEMTNAEYQSIIGMSPSPRGFDGKKQPVISVNWFEAKAACEKGYKDGRLPTRAEWQIAAEGPQHSEYGPQNKQINKQEAGYDSGRTKDVGTYPANGFGLDGMAGYVWEWVSDGSDDNKLKEVRGASSWRYSLDKVYLPPASRSGGIPGYADDVVGFRCVVAP